MEFNCRLVGSVYYLRPPCKIIVIFQGDDAQPFALDYRMDPRRAASGR